MELNEKFKMLSGLLPPLPKIWAGEPVTFDIVMLGSHLLNEGHSRDKYGFPIKANRYYTVTKVSYENHYKNIKKMYQSAADAEAGRLVVERYVAKVKAADAFRAKAELHDLIIKPQ